MDERDRRYEERFIAMDQKTSLALSASEKAANKADTATEKRFDSVNEFRGQLKDQAATLMPRAESDARFHSIEEKLEDSKEAGTQKSQFDLRTVLTVISMIVAIAAIFLKSR